MSKIEKGGTWVGLEIIGKLAGVLPGVAPARLLKLPPKRKRVSVGEHTLAQRVLLVTNARAATSLGIIGSPWYGAAKGPALITNSNSR
jgi:hypothetical protein